MSRIGNLSLRLGQVSVACGMGVIVAGEAAADPGAAAIAVMYREACRLAMTAEEVELALSQRPDHVARRDIVAGLDAVLVRPGAAAGEAITPTRADLPRQR